MTPEGSGFITDPSSSSDKNPHRGFLTQLSGILTMKHYSKLFYVLLVLGSILFFFLTPAGAAGQGKGVIRANTPWDLDSWKVSEENGGGDFFWEHTIQDEVYFRTLEGALTAVVSGKDYGAIDQKSVRAQSLLKREFPGHGKKSKIVPGTIIVFQTSEGRLGKLRIVRFRSSHDFNFAEARHISEAWKTMALKKDAVENYHLEVEWELFD
jgi:hypothetical protein